MKGQAILHSSYTTTALLSKTIRNNGQWPTLKCLWARNEAQKPSKSHNTFEPWPFPSHFKWRNTIKTHCKTIPRLPNFAFMPFPATKNKIEMWSSLLQIYQLLAWGACATYQKPRNRAEALKTKWGSQNKGAGGQCPLLCFRHFLTHCSSQAHSPLVAFGTWWTGDRAKWK